MYMSRRRRIELRKQQLACVIGLVAMLVIGGYINYVSWGAQVCADVPNHYTCTTTEE